MMKIDVNKLIDELAQKLGVATDYIMTLLHRQVIIDGIWDIIFAILCILGLIIPYKGFRHVYKVINSKENQQRHYPKSIDDFPIVMFYGVLVVILPVIAICCIKDAMDCLLNPDWQAIQYIISQFKN